jgi:hypothetical protein
MKVEELKHYLYDFDKEVKASLFLQNQNCCFRHSEKK